MNCLSEGYKWSVDQNWGHMSKIGFLGKKPRSVEKSCANKIVPFSKMNISLLVNFGCIFEKKWIFSQKTLFG